MSPRFVFAIDRPRRERRWGPRRIGWELQMAASKVYAVLSRLELHWLGRLQPKLVPIRYEWPRPGDLLHLDTKKLGRFGGVGKRFGGPRRSRSLGWDFVHVAIDDHSRLAYMTLSPTSTTHPVSTGQGPGVGTCQGSAGATVKDHPDQASRINRNRVKPQVTPE